MSALRVTHRLRCIKGRYSCLAARASKAIRQERQNPPARAVARVGRELLYATGIESDYARRSGRELSSSQVLRI